MKEFRASTTIAAPSETIWSILTESAAYPQFDPSCERIEGRIAVGEKLKVFSKLSPGRAFAVKVVEVVPGERMTWKGGMPLGLFEGVRTFTTKRAADGRFELEVHEIFRGPMLALIGGSLPDMSEAFRGFCAGLKARAEGQAR